MALFDLGPVVQSLDAIRGGIVNGLQWVVDQVTQFVTKCFTFPPWIWSTLTYVGASIVAVIAISGRVIVIVGNSFTSIVEAVANMHTNGTWQAASGSASSLFPAINTFFPFSELLSFLTTYVFLQLACALVRLLKGVVSFFPTMSN